MIPNANNNNNDNGYTGNASMTSMNKFIIVIIITIIIMITIINIIIIIMMCWLLLCCLGFSLTATRLHGCKRVAVGERTTTKHNNNESYTCIICHNY